MIRIGTYIISVPHFPGEDAKLRATSLQVRRGGNCSNTLEVLQQLLCPRSDGSGDSDGEEVESTEGLAAKVVLHLMSCLPNASSPARKKIVSSFGQDTKVDFSMCPAREEYAEPASSYIIRSEQTGSRTIVNFNELPEMTVDEFIERTTLLEGAECWWHFEVS